MQGDPSDEPNESTVGASAAGDRETGDSETSDNGLTPEEWAELERLTDPTAQHDERDQTPSSTSLDWEPLAAAREVPPAASSAPAAHMPTAVEEPPSSEAPPAPDEVTASSAPHGDPSRSEADGHVDGDRSDDDGPDEDRYDDDGPDEDRSDDDGPDEDRSDEDRAAVTDSDQGEEGRPRMPLPRVIAVANQKGGVGKTTTTVNIAACLAEQGYRTLLVDLDPQANASTGVGIDSRQLDHSIYDVMLHDQAADSVIEPTEVKNLFVLPSSLDLAGAEIELVSMLSREHRLRLAIESVLDDYDYVLIDCPPSLGLLTINALTAAREVLVPIQCEYYALEGLGQLMRNVELVRASLNPGLQISHIVLVMFDPRTKLAGQVVDEVRTHFGATVCENVIPRTVRLSEAPSFGQPITTFDSGSRGAAAYRAVTQEVLGGQA